MRLGKPTVTRPSAVGFSFASDGHPTRNEDGMYAAPIAVFLESYEPTLGAFKRQIQFVPYEHNVLVFARLTDGSKGPHNKWERTTLDALKAALKTGECLTKEPSGVILTTADYSAITSKGYSPVLGTKCNQAHERAPMTATNNPTNKAIDSIHDLVYSQDSALHDLVTDRRRQPVPTQAAAITIQPVAEISEDIAPQPAPVTERTLQLHLATVPPKELADRYVHRDVYGQSDFKVFDFARANHINVLIYGPTGPGKTTGVEAWAAARNLRLAQVSGNATMEPSQLFGKFIPDGEGGFMWCDGPVTDVVRNGGVLNLDEINFISPKVYTVLYTLLTSQRMITLMDHKGEVIHAHPDLTVFATMNPGYVGTTKLNFAMRNRFDIQLFWDYDTKVEAKLVKSKALQAVIKQLRDEAAKGSFETPISTNMLMEFEQIALSDLGFEFAVENFVGHFEEDEQPAVRMVLKTHESNLMDDLGLATNIVTDKGEESTEPVIKDVNDILSSI
jgi:hypothetical protein